MSKKQKEDAGYIANALAEAKKRACATDPSLESFSEIARRSGVKVNTIQNWFQAKCVPRVSDLARVAVVLSVPIESFVKLSPKKVFHQMGLEEMVEKLGSKGRSDLSSAVRSILDTAMRTNDPDSVVAAFRKQIDSCAEMCRKLH